MAMTSKNETTKEAHKTTPHGHELSKDSEMPTYEEADLKELATFSD